MSEKQGSGADAVIVFDGKILLVLRDDIPGIASPNMWNMPGGGIDDGESPEEAVRRELQEEICVSPKHIEFIEVTNYDNAGEVHRFLVKLNQEEYAQVRLGNEGQRIGWFAVEELDEISIAHRNKIFFDHRREMIERMIKESTNIREGREGGVKVL